MVTRGRLAVGAIVALAGAAALLALVAAGRGVQEGGPLAVPGQPRTAFAAPVDVGRPYSWGLVYLMNGGDETAVVDRVTLVGRPRGMEVVGMYAIPAKNRRGIGFVEGYRPMGGRKVSGLRVPPSSEAREGLQLVIGLEVERRGVFSVRAVRVDYHVGDRRYRATLEHAVRMCAPRDAYETCPTPAAEGGGAVEDG